MPSNEPASDMARAIGFQQRQELEPAIALYRRILEREPGLAQAWCNLGLALGGLNRHDAAMAAFDRAMAIAPEAPLVRLNRAQLLLQTGEWDAGWEEYEWRWALPRRQRPTLAPDWDGSGVGARTLLLFSELGLGDTIQMARYLPLILSGVRGGRVLLACQAPLRRLLAGIVGLEVLSEDSPLLPVDVALPLCSLPKVFGTRVWNVPKPPVLVVPPGGAAAARVRAVARPRIGVVWAGNPQMLNDGTRSMPVQALQPLTGIVPQGMFSLQKGAAAEQALADSAVGFTPLGPLLDDMADTAAAIRALDLVITVCTSVAHLAGTLGVPTWLMLSYSADWRWLIGRDTTPWYPSMWIFRQARRGDWDEMVGRIGQELARFVAVRGVG